MKLLKRLWYNLPKHKKDIWYNRAHWTSKSKYPIIFDYNSDYIDCEIGLEVVMGKTKDGLTIYYEVIKKWKTKGSDFLYNSDSINCDLKFKDVR